MTILESKKHIRNAWIASIIAASVTLALSLLSLAGTSLGGYNVWNLFDAVFIAGMAFGIFRRSRICAVLMLVYYLASTIMSITEKPVGIAIVVPVIFIYYYAKGVQGTFVWRRLNEKEPNQAPDPTRTGSGASTKL